MKESGMKERFLACEIDLAVAGWLLSRGCASTITHFYPRRWHECDVYAITKTGYGVEVEVKISVADFRADFKKKKRKHKAFAMAMQVDCSPGFATGGPRRYYFAAPKGMIGIDDIPDYAGLLYAQRYEATQWNKEGIVITVAKPAPVLRAAKKVTVGQLRELDIAYKYHYYTLLRKLVEVRRGGKEE